jgi:hypothetical protein
MLRTTTAAIAIVLLAGAAQAAPALTPAKDTSLVIKVVSDATSENDAIELEENELPGGNNPSMSDGADPYARGSNDYESKQLNEEFNE